MYFSPQSSISRAFRSRASIWRSRTDLAESSMLDPDPDPLARMEALTQELGNGSHRGHHIAHFIALSGRSADVRGAKSRWRHHSIVLSESTRLPRKLSLDKRCSVFGLRGMRPQSMSPHCQKPPDVFTKIASSHELLMLPSSRLSRSTSATEPCTCSDNPRSADLTSIHLTGVSSQFIPLSKWHPACNTKYRCELSQR